MSDQDPLLERRLIVVTGKGGVGKSALTATLGRYLASRGRRVLILEIDPRENLHQLLAVAPSDGAVVEVGRRLYLQNLKPRESVDWVVEKQVKISLLVNRLKSSPIYQRFVEGSPGLSEMAILGHAVRLVRGELKKVPPIDVVVLDAPATGHGVYLLTAPRLFAEVVGAGPFAEIARDVADFIDDPHEHAVVVVTLAEEMPVQEALELREALQEKFGRAPELLIANGLYPPVDAELGDAALASLWRERRRVNERELAHLDRAWSGPRVDLPLFAIDRGPTLIAALTDHFTAAWDALRDGES
jgi:Mrp family chromosome partitioning ATPase